MSFVGWPFPLFFALVWAAYWALPRRGQNLLLLVASVVFYGWVHPMWVVLLVASILLDFTMARWIEDRPARARLWVACSVAGNLALLGTFKYLDFFVGNAVVALASLGIPAHAPVLGLVLPAGISFYTFQTMAYTIDVSRGHTHARRDLLDHAVFVSFFPQLVAGPIERAGRLLPQIETSRRFDADRVLSGVSLATWGAVLKVCVADLVAPHVDRIFALDRPAAALVWVATLGFGLQILADFAGYTAIARGLARMLGIELSDNFRRPYLARHPRQLWQRWHRTLSSWFRDYMYLPLGGSRHGPWRTALAIVITFGLSGLWHGASWNFVLWGLWHAALLLVYRAVRPWLPSDLARHRAARALGIGLMFLATNAGWLLFRQRDLGAVAHTLGQAPWTAPGASGDEALATLGVVALAAMPLWGSIAWDRWAAPWLAESTWRVPVRVWMITAGALAVATLARGRAADFVYFRF